MFIIFGGLPATGKPTLDRLLALQLSAVYLRIDTIEQAMAPTDVMSVPASPRSLRLRSVSSARADRQTNPSSR